MSPGQREIIRNSRFVSNPGCYPTGFILALKPLVNNGLVPEGYPVTVHALSGYSGGGKKLINTYEDQELTDSSVLSSRPYGFSLAHKHVPEMQKYTGLSYPPVFSPSVGNFYHGMLVNIPLFTHLFSGKAYVDDVRKMLQETYQNESFVKVMPSSAEEYLENGFLSPLGCNKTNRVEIFVSGHNDQILLTARLDNLGKGASGAAVQNLNIMLGFDEEKGLKVAE
jgi:N-acetyl-gamma-glutamyl-phosphate reductase